MALEGFSLGTAYASVILDASGIQSGINQAKSSIASGMQSIGDSFKSVGQSITGIGVGLTALGAPALAFAASSIKAATDARKEYSQLDAVLRSTGGAAGMTKEAVLDLANGLQSMTNFSNDTVLSAEDMLLTFTNIGSNIFPQATKAVLNMSTALGQDTKNSAIQLGKALQDPVAGITALRRVGVAFTDAQKDMIKTMVASGDTMGAQKLILAELDKEFGGSAEAAVNADGGMAQFQNRLNDTQETIGNLLLPMMRNLIGGLQGVLDWFNALDPGIQQTIVSVIALVASLAIIGPIIAAIGLGITAVGTIIAGVGALLAGPLVPIALIIAGLVLLAQHFGITLDNIKLYMSLAQLYIEYYATNIVTAIQGVIKGIQDWVAANPELSTALLLVGGVIVGATVLVGAIGVASTVAAAAVGVLAGAVGILLSPVVLLAAAIGVLLFAINALYPGGLSGVLKDAATSAQQLAFIITYYVNEAAKTATAIIGALVTKINELKATMSGLGAYQGVADNASTIAQGVQSGQYSIGDVINAAGNAIGAQLSSTGGAYAAASNTGGGASFGGANLAAASGGAQFAGAGSGGDIHLNGDININANSYAEGKDAANGALDAIQERRRARGG